MQVQYRIKKQSHGGLRNKKNKRERHMPSFTLEREKTVTSKNKQSTLVIVRVTPVKHKSSLDKKIMSIALDTPRKMTCFWGDFS